MITVTILKKNGQISELKATGHAGFGAEGEDIVCAGVSALLLNTINSLDAFTDAVFGCDVEEIDGGYLRFLISDDSLQDGQAQLLLRACELGLASIAEEYHEYARLIVQEIKIS